MVEAIVRVYFEISVESSRLVSTCQLCGLIRLTLHHYPIFLVNLCCLHVTTLRLNAIVRVN
jgi:hypothetical protein